MRSFLKAAVSVFAAAVLVGDLSIASAQEIGDAARLDKELIELYRAGRYSDAIPIAQRALAIRERALGRDHPDVAAALNNLALLYDKEGRYDEAEPLYERALVIQEKSFGPNHPNVGISLNNLAALCLARGPYPGP